MNRKEKREKLKQLERENSQYPDELIGVPKSEWPSESPGRIMVLRSKTFLLQVYKENGAIRLSINRTVVDHNMKWKERISWEQLQELKRQAGYGDQLAVEIYPCDKDVVNVANMRHLWIIEGLKAGWVNG